MAGKKILVVVLIAAMAIAAAGCSPAPKQTDADPTAAPTAKPTEAPSAEPEAKTEKQGESIVISMYVTADEPEFNKEQQQRFMHVFRREDDGHALLGFGDGELRAVEALVFFRHLVEVDRKPVRQLADGDADAARAEIVAAADQARHLRPAEQALDLALRGRVALLHLGAAGLDGL